MVFQASNPDDLRKCRFCGKDVVNMAAHIIRQHPNIISQLEEKPQEEVRSSGASNFQRVSSVNELIREKLDTMLNIKIIEQLSANPKMTLTELNQAVNPLPPKPEKTLLEQIEEIKAIQGLFTETTIPGESSSEWLGIVKEALPLVRDMMQRKQNVRTGETGIKASSGAERLATPGDAKQSDSSTKQSSSLSEAEQQYNQLVAKVNGNIG
jgi:hypothetical protein